MATAAEAVAAEDAVQLIALLTRTRMTDVEATDGDEAVSVCDAALALGAAREAGLGSAVAASVARATLHTRALGAPRGPAHAPLPSGELAHLLDAQLQAVTTVWDASVPRELRTRSTRTLAECVRRARAEVTSADADAAAAGAAAAFASARARDMRVEAATVALGALEADVRERARPRCAGDAAAARAISRGNAVVAKLRLLRASIAAQLYDTAAVQALRDAAAALERELAQLEPQAAAAAAAVARFRAVEQQHGEEFAAILRDHRSLSRALEEKRWSLKELGVS
eukprot:IDg15538t1